MKTFARHGHLLVCVLLLALGAFGVSEAAQEAQGQPRAGGQGSSQAQSVPASAKPVLQTVRVPTSHANVHATAGSGAQILVLVPKGTVLDVIGRRGEWLNVRLTPEMRKTGIVMRWYKQEDNGWMHDSTVEVIKPGAK
jgi:hypothetical protein